MRRSESLDPRLRGRRYVPRPASRCLDRHHALVFAPDVAQDAADLAESNVALDALDEQRHHVLRPLRHFFQASEELPYAFVVAGRPQLL